MKLKSKIFSLAIVAASTISIVACNEEEASPAADPNTVEEQGFQTYVYKGVRFQEPIDNDGKFVNAALTAAWTNNPNAAMLQEDDMLYIYDSNAELDQALTKNGSRKITDNAKMNDFRYCDVFLYKDDSPGGKLLDSYSGDAANYQTDFRGKRGINDEVSSLIVSNGSSISSNGLMLVTKFFEHSDLRGHVYTVKVRAGGTQIRPRLKDVNFNDEISSWQFFYMIG